MERRYTVAQAVKLTGVKSYVLRYWEEEMELTIGRNELGHRYYTGYDIQLFLNIKELKNRGLQLKAIKELLPRISAGSSLEEIPPAELLEEDGAEQEADGQEPEKPSGREAPFAKGQKDGTPQGSSKILEFQDILERLISQELHAQREGEDRWRSIDEAIRRQQQARREAAAAGEKKNRRRSRRENT
ncbi:MAG: MerR family transcriptional regulator [Eubacteriales bacterium]|nr:MerR family transcriptional regulator [Eubacteriales bacterium]